MFENGAVREVYGFVMEEIKEDCRKIHS